MTREEEIISIVSQKKKIEVNELSELLNVSKVTIRKDLDKLESRGLLHRQHGFALLIGSKLRFKTKNRLRSQ